MQNDRHSALFSQPPHQNWKQTDGLTREIHSKQRVDANIGNNSQQSGLNCHHFDFFDGMSKLAGGWWAVAGGWWGVGRGGARRRIEWTRPFPPTKKKEKKTATWSHLHTHLHIHLRSHQRSILTDFVCRVKPFADSKRHSNQIRMKRAHFPETGIRRINFDANVYFIWICSDMYDIVAMFRSLIFTSFHSNSNQHGKSFSPNPIDWMNGFNCARKRNDESIQSVQLYNWIHLSEQSRRRRIRRWRWRRRCWSVR